MGCYLKAKEGQNTDNTNGQLGEATSFIGVTYRNIDIRLFIKAKMTQK